MNDKKHMWTDEPWEFLADESLECQEDNTIPILPVRGGVSICDVTTRDGEGRLTAKSRFRGMSNGLRIVACVNACAGMDDPEVRINAMRSALEKIHANAAESPEWIRRVVNEALTA